VGGSVVEIVVTLLDVFSVITFMASQAEEAFLENRVVPVPEGYGKANFLMTIADSRNSILIPAISPRPGVIVRQVFPGRPMFAVIFANGSPRTLA
jgi:hypothetical protein